MSPYDVDPFTRGYMECALWSSMDFADESGGEPLDANYSIEDIAPETLAEMIADCAEFQKENAALLALIDPSQAGHDFWLTRNHHGAGFWDRGLGAIGNQLTHSAHAYNGRDLYIGENQKVYQS